MTSERNVLQKGDQVIGTCQYCGGLVVVPVNVTSAVPACINCNRTPAHHTACQRWPGEESLLDYVQPAPLSFNQFQAANAKRCPEAFSHGLDSWSLLEWAGAMCGEAGEVANVCKKIRRKEQGVGGKWAERDPDVSVQMMHLADEIGDTLSYLSLLASAAGLRLADCAARKFDAISDKVGWEGERLMPKPVPTINPREFLKP